MTINDHNNKSSLQALAGVTGLAIFTGLMIALPSPLKIALGSATAGFSFGVAGSVAISRKQCEGCQDSARLEADISSLKVQIDNQSKLLSDARAELKTARELSDTHLQQASRLRQLLSQEESVNQAVRADREKMASEVKASGDRLLEAQKSLSETIASYEQQLADVKAMNVWLAALTAKLNSSLVGRVGAKFQEARELIAAEYESDLNHMNKVHSELVGEYERELDKQENVISQLEQDLRLLTVQRETLKEQLAIALAPKRLASVGRAADAANRIADWFLNRGVVIDIECSGESKTSITMKFKARNADKSTLDSLLEQLWIDFETESEPSLDIDGGFYKLVLNTDKSTNEAVRKAKAKPLMPDEYMSTIAAKPMHFRITGASESGKSAFVNNLIGYLSASNPDLEIELIDPAYGSLESTYSGLISKNTIAKDDDESIDALEALAVEVGRRAAKVRRAKDAGLELPSFSKKLVIVDEADRLYAHDKSAAKHWLAIAKTGRHVGLYIALVGQSANVAPVGLEKPDQNNFIVVSVGVSNIEIALSKDDALTPVAKRSINALAKQASNDHGKYVAMVRLKTAETLIGVLPEPGRYEQASNQLELASSHQQPVEHHLADETAIEQLERLFSLEADRASLPESIKPEQPASSQPANDLPVARLIDGLSFEDTVRQLAKTYTGARNQLIPKLVFDIYGIKPNRGEYYQRLKNSGWTKEVSDRIRSIIQSA